MVWSAFVVDTMSGQKVMPVFPSSGQCRSVLNGVGSGSHSFHLRDKKTAFPSSATARDVFRPWARTLVICWDDVPVYAGIIMRWSWDRDTGVLTVDHREFRALLSKRYAWLVPTYPTSTVNPQPWSWTVTGKSLRGIARAVVAKTTKLVPGDGWDMPVVLGADESGSRSMTWWAFNFLSGEDMLSQVQDSDGGPDVFFRPRWSSSGSLEWVFEAGTPRLGGGVVERIAPAPKSPGLRSVTVMDGTDQLTGLFGLGEGSEQDMKVGLAGPLAGSSIPTMDTKRSLKNADTQASVDALSWGALRDDREPIRQYNTSTIVGEFFPSCGVGGTLREYLSDDEMIADGWVNYYVIGTSMRWGSEQMDVEVMV